MNLRDHFKLNRREMLKLGLMSGAATLLGASRLGSLPAWACDAGGEPFPTSPLILSPFKDALPIPKALRPSDPRTWKDRNGVSRPPGPGIGQQDFFGGTHQVWPKTLGLPDPIYYKIDLKVAEHRFTTSLVQPIDSLGNNVVAPDGIFGPRSLPASTIYGFNGTFPGPRINVEYGRPVLVRFENFLDINDLNLDRQDFGAPDLAFLTHLHNGHTAPESDGNPFYRPDGYEPGEWVDNLYLNWPAGGDARNTQSFFWFHDHRMDHTGANVYKGMVGLFPLYDRIDNCSESDKLGLRLPGVRTNYKDGTFDVDYDIPLAIYDCGLDDGITLHQDAHDAGTACGLTHPEWWGKTFFRHYPNHGFVGDIFTVNGVAFPVLQVKRRKYRFRFLDASISRIYEFKLMSSVGGPKASRDTELSPGVPRTGVHLQGQYQLPDGQECMQFVQIATDGGLMPAPLVRDSFQLWPAKRREVIIDFSKYMDGSATSKNDVVYLVNTRQMSDGRKPDELGETTFDPNYRVPMLKFVISGNAVDKSEIPAKLRDLPPVPSQSVLDSLNHRSFEFSRSGNAGAESSWQINKLPFDPTHSLAQPKAGSGEVWTFINGGGGWVHPVHIHQEEHQILSRTDGLHVDDNSREDVVALAPGESVTFYRQFRTFLGKYVCHCHNLAHEDHAMMFGWEIIP